MALLTSVRLAKHSLGEDGGDGGRDGVGLAVGVDGRVEALLGVVVHHLRGWYTRIS